MLITNRTQMKYPLLTKQLLIDRAIPPSIINDFEQLFGLGPLVLTEQLVVEAAKAFAFDYLGTKLLDVNDTKLYIKVSAHYWNEWYSFHLYLYNRYSDIYTAIKKGGRPPTQQDFYDYIVPDNRAYNKAIKQAALGFYYLYSI